MPADNPMSLEKVELGRRLFYDRRLSGNGSFACATCHQQRLAFTDGLARAVGATGERHPRSSMSLANVAWLPTFGWSDPLTRSLEDQAAIPMQGRDPIELGVTGAEETVLDRLRASGDYRARFALAFPGDADPITLDNVRRAIASFERTLVSGGSAFDRLVYADDSDALDAEARQGMGLFFSERVGCARCHGGIAFAGSLPGLDDPRPQHFFDNGLDDPTSGTASTRFRVPTLRNVAVTAPYMHDGRLGTLEEVVLHYARAGREGRGDLRPFTLAPVEIDQLVAFLRSLTDPSFLSDPRFADPFGAPLD